MNDLHETIDHAAHVRLECVKLCGPLHRQDGLDVMLATAEKIAAYVLGKTEQAPGKPGNPAPKPKGKAGPVTV